MDLSSAGKLDSFQVLSEPPVCVSLCHSLFLSSLPISYIVTVPLSKTGNQHSCNTVTQSIDIISISPSAPLKSPFGPESRITQCILSSYILCLLCSVMVPKPLFIFLTMTFLKRPARSFVECLLAWSFWHVFRMKLRLCVLDGKAVEVVCALHSASQQEVHTVDLSHHSLMMLTLLSWLRWSPSSFSNVKFLFFLLVINNYFMGRYFKLMSVLYFLSDFFAANFSIHY